MEELNNDSGLFIAAIDNNTREYLAKFNIPVKVLSLQDIVY